MIMGVNPPKTNAMTTEPQEKFTFMPNATKGQTPGAQDEIQSQQFGEHLLNNGPHIQVRATKPSNVDEESRKHEAHMPAVATKPDEVNSESLSHEARSSPDAIVKLKHASKADGDQIVSVFAAPTTKDKQQPEKQVDTGQESSDDVSQKEDAMMKAYETLINEEAGIEKRIGFPSERIIDKTRLSVVKQEIQRIRVAMDENKILEDIDVVEGMRVAQSLIGDPLHGLRSNSSKSSRSTTRMITRSTAKKRKDPSEKTNKSPKKKKLDEKLAKKVKDSSEKTKEPAKERKPNGKLQQQVKDADAIAKYTFDQLAGRGTATTGNTNLLKTVPSLRGLSKDRREALKKIRAAAKNIEANDAATKARIEADIHLIFSMTRPFGKSCSLKILREDVCSVEEGSIDDYGWAIEGMTYPLRHHQVIAAGLMCIMEEAGVCRGGCLCDYMGLGKTVETIALAIQNQANKDTHESGDATTLVVVPTAVAQQWADELRLHCPGLIASAWTKHADMRALMSSKFLIITYPELRAAYKEAGGAKGRGNKKPKGDEEESSPVLNHPLFNAKFHRIVLDEMHEIKGYRNVTYDSVMALNAKYKWGLTGTPTPNGIEELYPYLKFVGHPDITTMADFKKRFVSGKGSDALLEEERFERLRKLLTSVMIMRTPSQLFLGSTLLKLPPGHAMPPIKVRLSAEEGIIYRSIEEKMKDRIEKKSTSKKKGVGVDMLMQCLVRLRQCITSPLLLENLATECFWSSDDVDSMRQEARDAGSQTTPFIDQIEGWIQKISLGHASTTSGKVNPEKSIADARALLDEGTCPGNACEKTITQLTEPQMAECGHAWCKPCLEKQIMIELIIEKRKTPECSRCHKPLGQAKPFSPAALRNQNRTVKSADTVSSSQQRPGEDYNGKEPRRGGPNNIMNFLDQDPTVKVPRSAKVDAVIRLVVDLQNEAPEDKIISTYTGNLST